MKSVFYNTAESAYRSPTRAARARAISYIVGKHRVKKLFLVIGDAIVLYVALFVALILRHQSLPSYGDLRAHFWPFSALFAGWLLIFYIGDLYEIAVSKNEVKFY